MTRLPLSRAVVATGMTLAIAFAVSLFNDQTSARTANSDTYSKTRSLVGSYLAGRFARNDNDANLAADFYRRALARDPSNLVLLEQTFLMEATAGNWTQALHFARKLIKVKPDHRNARLVLGVEAFKKKDYQTAREHFQNGNKGPIGELTSSIATAWTHVAQGKTNTALKTLENTKQAEWAKFYLLYHRALIADVAGFKKTARSSFARVYQQDSRTLRTMLAYARHVARSGDIKTAREILVQNIEQSGQEPHPLTEALLIDLADGADIELIVRTPEQGLAEVFYGLGEALTGEGGVGLGLLYLQTAIFLEPQQSFALAALASAYEAARRYDDAIETYNRIPKGSPLQMSVEIRKAYNYNSLEKVDDAERVLNALIQAFPDDIRPLDAMGSIMRSHKRYSESVTYFTKIIDLLDKPERGDWTYYYARGTSFERLKKWPKAEKDLLKALELFPDQPLALNYLGYSWIDQNVNLERGLSLVKKAVQLKPEDGYIVDSLGWGYYKIGNYDKAVTYLEKAVELRPEDPILNDHLGDALWQVGRRREARFQWEQAITLDPEPDILKLIKKKLADGLNSKSEAKVLKRTDAGALAP